MMKQALSLLKDFKRIEAKDDMAGFKDQFNVMVDELNVRMKEFPLEALNGQILEVVLPATSTVRVSHSLETVPKYRLILAQIGNGVITDVKGKDSDLIEQWNNKYVSLYNNGAVEVTIKLMLIRE